ncbi:Ubiquitin-like protein ATG12 [Tolypocladium paradoxum]|uniref:Ubiquitin-like protein ATG12 n=1 Tax=Tolypocladium paradoxum TaxID=94208 RepID=A0A2S4LAB6_9HYPO|nr:Ubiquitin-like protein ATG12 [Tolypocladium paradoxum]
MDPRPASPGDRPSPSPPAQATPSPVPEDDDAGASPELPLTMSASVILADLPRDASAALASAGGFPQQKVVVRFKAVGAAPGLAQDLCKISAERKFEEVVRYLRRKLRCGDTDSVFLYVNSAFAPSLDEVVGNLHRCFKNAHDQLVVAYSMTPAFG